jgi:hypothetical protein
MANTTSQVETWSSFYRHKKEEIPTLQACSDMSFEDYDTMTQALNQLGDKLVLRMATLPHNFILLPGSSTQGKILLLHHCFTVSEPGERPILVGINEDRYSSPFKAFDPNDATVSLKPPTVVELTPRIATRGKPIDSQNKNFIPTLKQFLEVDDENHFMGLSGDDTGQEVQTLVDWPTSFLLHPEVFTCLVGVKEIRAREAALILIRAIIQAYNPAREQSNQNQRSTSSNSQDDESHGADHEPQISLEFSEQATKCYRLLGFLWAISNGMGTETQIDDPPSQGSLTHA